MVPKSRSFVLHEHAPLFSHLLQADCAANVSTVNLQNIFFIFFSFNSSLVKSSMFQVQFLRIFSGMYLCYFYFWFILGMIRREKVDRLKLLDCGALWILLSFSLGMQWAMSEIDNTRGGSARLVKMTISTSPTELFGHFLRFLPPLIVLYFLEM